MKIKKAVKIAGNVLTLLALALIVRRLLTMDVDYSFLLRRDRILWMIVLTVLYGIHIALIPFSWQQIIGMTTGRRLPFLTVEKVFCKSNLLKYIPGNVFQYVGRNEIAVLYDLRHRDVALSTVLDVGANVIGVSIISLICYATGFRVGWQSIGISLSWPVVAAVLAGVAVLIGALYWKRALYWNVVKRICTRQNLSQYGICIAYYAFFAVYTGLIYYVILTQILNVPIESGTTFLVIGAYQLSWLLGFLMPGVPGGIGIRETAIVALLSPYMQTEPVLLAIVIFRIVNTIGDFVGFAGTTLLNQLVKRRKA